MPFRPLQAALCADRMSTLDFRKFRNSRVNIQYAVKTAATSPVCHCCLTGSCQ